MLEQAKSDFQNCQNHFLIPMASEHPKTAFGASTSTSQKTRPKIQNPSKLLFSSQTDSTQISTSERAIAAILVHLDQFQVLILPHGDRGKLNHFEMQSR